MNTNLKSCVKVQKKYTCSDDYNTQSVEHAVNLLQMPANRFPRNCYLLLKSLDDAGRICWASKIRNLLFTYGFGYTWISQDVGDKNMFISSFKQRVIDCCTQKWNDDVSNSSRCHHYKHYKSLLNTEKYLSIDLTPKYKIALSNFRGLNHKLQIEQGRHNNVQNENRICNNCSTNEVRYLDCEYHANFL